MFVVENTNDNYLSNNFIRYNKFLFVKPDRVVLKRAKSLKKQQKYHLKDYIVKNYKGHDYISCYILEEINAIPSKKCLFIND